MPGEKKSFKAELKLSPTEEMDKRTSEWFKKHSLAKKIDDFTHSQVVELDSRKWDVKKLRKGLVALVRYEAKLFASRGAEWVKKTDANNGELPKDCVKQYQKYHAKIQKMMTNKCEDALEELEADKGDNKKALAAGKAALKNFEKLNVIGLFSVPTKAVTTVFVVLAGELKKAAGNDKAIEKAYRTAGGSADKARDAFEKQGKQVGNTVKFLIKTGKDLENDKNADQMVSDFGKLVSKESKTFSEFADAMQAFEIDIDAAVADIASRKLDPDLCASKAKAFAKYAKLEGKAKSAVAAVKKLKPKFNDVEKKLK